MAGSSGPSLERGQLPGGRAGRMILLAGAIALLAACGPAPSSAPGASAPAKRPASPAGSVAAEPAPQHFPAGTTLVPVSAIAVLSDDRTLVAVTFSGCGGPPRLVTTELPGSVVLVVAEPPPPAGAVCATVLRIGPVRTRLTSPLGSRSLLRRTSLTRIPAVYQDSLAAVGVLPPGYRLTGLVPGSGFSAMTRGDQDYSTRTYSARRSAPVTISEATGTVLPDGPNGWAVTTLADVGGHRAVCRAGVLDGRVYARSVAWRAGGRVFVVASAEGLAGQRIPSQAQLLAMARSVR